MAEVNIKIDGKELSVPAEISVKKAAIMNGIYIPGVCSHPDLDPFKPFNWSEEIWQGENRFDNDTPPESPPTDAGGEKSLFPHCNLCQVSVDGKDPQRACDLRVREGMEVSTASSEVSTARKDALKLILADHPHACLTCAQREGCDRVQCSMDVPVEQRCCELLGRCEIGKVAEFIGIPGDTPAYKPLGRPAVTDEPLFVRDYELCINCLRCVRVCRDVRGVDALGAVLTANTVKVGTHNGPTLDEAECMFCGACVELCPTGTLRDQPGVETLIDGHAPCSSSCPLGIDVPGYIELIGDNLEYEALELIRQKAVLPGVLGYACFHPCEDSCRRNSINDAASICALKRYVSDVAGDEEPKIKKAEPTGKNVAVIGGGPAGLAAAAELLKLGHEVTIFERDSQLGGMLRQTIPEFRLPDEVIERDLKYIHALGLKTELNAKFDKDNPPESLLSKGYDAVITALGLPKALSLRIEGEALENVQSGLEFLRTSSTGEAERIDGSAVIIGGGAVAVDAALTARRLGAAKVTMVCLEAEGELPAFKEEMEAAFAEGIETMTSWGVKSIQTLENRLSLELKRCTRVFDPAGKFSPEYDESVSEIIIADNVIVAIGQSAEVGLINSERQVDGLFHAGDAVTGPTSIVAAMADGKRVALDVDRYLGGAGVSADAAVQVKKQITKVSNFLDLSRVEAEEVLPAERVLNLKPFKATLTKEQAQDEAARCLRCHLRASLTKTPLPPDPWRSFTDELVSEIPSVEGVLILADQNKQSVKISGSSDMKSAYADLLMEGFEAEYCRWEVDPMYTQRESELIQAHLQAHGEIPGGDELDDLF